MAQQGREVTILEMLDHLNDGGNPLHGYALSLEMKKLHIKVVLSVKAVKINKDGVAAEPVDENMNPEPCSTVASATLDSPSYWQTFKVDEDDREPRLYKADTVIYAVGQKPRWEDAEKIRCIAPEFYMIGDCLTPKNIAQATNTARFVARDIGRL